MPDPDTLPSYEAVALFVERARAVKPNFRLDEANAEAVAQICLRLDGLPFAIKLAAARSKLLSPQAMLGRLSRRLEVLIGGARDLAGRHKTLRGTLQWSYEFYRGLHSIMPMDSHANAIFLRVVIIDECL